MKTEKFNLTSGALLTVTTAEYEAAVGLVEAVKAATMGFADTMEVGDVVLSNPLVRKALYLCWPKCLYEQNGKTFTLSPSLFDDPIAGDKAREDYFEICGKVIEVNCRPFFLKSSSRSTTVIGSPPENRA